MNDAINHDPINSVRMMVFRDPSRGFDLTMYARTRTHAAQPLVMAPQSPGTYVPPFAVLSEIEAQILMDSLWDAGIRPSAGHGSAGEREAMRLHLDDMRRIAFLHIDGGKP